MSYELVKRAIDSNGFVSTQTEAGYVNPEVWDRKVLEHEKDNLVVAKLGKFYDFTQPGDVYDVTVDVEPSAASAVLEGSDLTITQLTFSQVQFTPSERGAAYQLSDKEGRRAFFSVMDNMAMKLGYRLALAKDALCITRITAGATTTIFANGKTVVGSLTSSDTLDYKDLISAKATLSKLKFNAFAAVLHPYQIGALLTDSTYVITASDYGDKTKVAGLITRIAGMDIYESQSIALSSNVATSIVMGSTADGVAPFGIVQKANPQIRTEYHALGRYTDVVGVEDYDVQVLHADGLVLLKTWAAA